MDELSLLTGVVPLAPTPVNIPPAPVAPPVPPVATTPPGFDPATGGIIKTPSPPQGGLKERLHSMLAGFGPSAAFLVEAVWELFQWHQANTEKKLNENQQSQIDAQERVDKRHDQLIEAQERLNLAQQAEIDELKKAVLAQQRQINGLMGVSAPTTPPPAKPATPTTPPPSGGKGLFGP